jgi:uncharacterized Zn-binding protein involved in type VI secretion
MLNPGVPPPPHVGGTVMLGSPTVLICGQMAARMGDMAMCSGPPDSVMMGCPTVLIGESAGGGGGGGGPAGSAASAAVAGGGTTPKQQGDHFLHVKFVDKAGLPVMGVNYQLKSPTADKSEGTLKGEIRKTGIQQGNYEISLMAIRGAKWSQRSAAVGDKVKLLAETVGIESGEKAILSIFIRDAYSPDHLYRILETQVKNDRIEAEWTLEIEEELLKIQEKKFESGTYYSPQFYFAVKTAECSARSRILPVKDWIEIELKDDAGNPAAGAKYQLHLSNGTIKDGTLDSNGCARVDNIPPGKIEVTFVQGESIC